MTSLRNDVRLTPYLPRARSSAPEPTAQKPAEIYQVPAARAAVASALMPQLSAPLAQVSRGTLRSWIVPPQQCVRLQGIDALVFVKEGVCAVTDDDAPQLSSALPSDSALATTVASRLTLANPNRQHALHLLRVDLAVEHLPVASADAAPSVVNIQGALGLAAPDGTAIKLLATAKSDGGGMITAELPPHCMSTAVRHKTVQEIWSVVRGSGSFHLVGPGAEPQRTLALRLGTVLTIPTGALFQFEAGEQGLKAAIFTLPKWPGPDEGELPDGAPFQASPKDAEGYSCRD